MTQPNVDEIFNYGDSIYDRETNPNNNRLREQNSYGKPELSIGDKVWRVTGGDDSFGKVQGTVEQTEGMSGRVVVRWPNGVAYQVDPLHL